MSKHLYLRICPSIYFLMTLFFSFQSAAQNWRWAGFEVIGNNTITTAELISRIPITVGEVYKEEPSSWRTWCEDLKNHFKFHYAHCSMVRYINFQAYFVIDVVEEGYEYRNQFRPEPMGDVELASPEILDLYDRLYARLWELFGQGTGSQESANKGYLDYGDSAMHEIVEQLIKLVPSYRENLLEVLEMDKDLNKREKAANLLNWTMTDLPDSILRASRLLDDPSDIVRNNISRFTMHFINWLPSPKDREVVIDRLLVQLDRPSHADRNKSIYNLLALAHAIPGDREYIRSKGISLIESIAKSSVLENVRDPAIELLAIIKQ